MYPRLIKVIIFLGILFGLVFGYHLFGTIMMKRYMKAQGNPPITVSTQKVTTTAWQRQLTASGSLRALNGVDVTTELAGMIRNIAFKPGARIQKDALIVKLNDDVEVAQLQSLLAQADIARITYERDKAQYQAQAISKQTVDNDAANLKNLLAQVAEQKATVAKKTIRAPFTGKSGICAVNLGQYIQPGDKIVTLQELDPIYIDFYIPQQNVPDLKVGQPITLTTDTYPGEKFIGKISTIDPKIDPSTRNVQVEATLPNCDNKLLPGMYGTVEINVGKPSDFLTLPQTAITFNPYGEIAYTIAEKGKDKKGKPILIANQTFVSVGDKRGDQVAVLKGLKAGETVVISGGHKLKNGSTVLINNSVLPNNNPNPKAPNE